MMKRKLLEYCLAPLRTVVANPVVVRDLRAQMRGTKSYWFQGAYLLLLGILAISGYAQATSQTFSSLRGGGSAPVPVSIVEAQGRLESFYYFIFLTLAALITLIAPALTAGSIIGERQRQSLDLLITTPLSAGDLLIGKLLSSVAFLGLLLGLSMPASALCVLLGGATLGDVFRIYALLAVDGIVLAAIGLFFSCASRTSLLALVWTYLTVAAVLTGTWVLYTLSSVQAGNLTQATLTNPLLFLIALNPFVAVMPAAQMSWTLGSLVVPVWIGAAGIGSLILRLLVTAAAYRLGSHGGESGSSLRRQALLLSGGGSFLISYSILSNVLVYGAPLQEVGTSVMAGASAAILMVGFVLAVPFLPGLFVPVPAEEAPPGVSESGAAAGDGIFRFRRAFYPEHEGALPFYLLLITVLVTATLAAFGAASGTLPVHVVGTVICTGLYISALGFCFWAVSRFAAGLVRGATQARALAFGIFMILCALPILVLSLTTQSYSWHNEPAASLWLLYPFVPAQNSPDQLPIWLLICGLQGFAWGFAFILARMRWQRPALEAAA
jgi:ABC-type transport system involved in multi-copper enzyme maturation permease subunit